MAFLRTPGWRVATAPLAYGQVDDAQLCRHVRVSCELPLNDLKRAVIAAFEDQYSPSQVRLFSRRYDDSAVQLRTDRQVKKVLSYAPDWTDLACDDGKIGTVLLVVSSMNEEESDLLLIPAAHSVPQASIFIDCALHFDSTARRGLSAALPSIQRLASHQNLFDPLPLPAHIDDWLAQYREATQSVSELCSSECARNTHHRAICLQPLVDRSSSSACESALFDGLRSFLEAFFQGLLTSCVRGGVGEVSHAWHTLADVYLSLRH